MTATVERYFRLAQRGTGVRTEVTAGVTTFLTMAYIAFVNPQILSNADMPFDAVFVATCLAAAFSTLVMGLYANYPIALAPGMGLNAFFAYGGVLGLGHTWEVALQVGMISVILTFLIVDLFDTTGTLIGVAHQAQLLDDQGQLPRMQRALIADSTGTVGGALLSTSPVTSYIENAAEVSPRGRTGLTAVAVAGLLLACLFLAPRVHAQNAAPIFTWPGEVQVSTDTLTIREGEALTYNIRLSEQPSADDWWVRVHVDGVVYIDGSLDEKGIRWVPSVGWEFNQEGSSGPTRWRQVRIEALQDDDAEDEFVTFTHDVWDENSNCPTFLHGVATVSVRIIDDDDPGGSGAPGVAVSPTSLTVSEGGTGTYAVVLESQPTGTG